MNQSILFPDDQSWDEASQQVHFPAQCQGALVECIVAVSELEQISGQKIAGREDALSIFSQYRFDFEELAERLIENEEDNALGQIEVVL
ncbi:DUF1488 family protein [Vibrio mangrovi]|uniref:DUF1488 domain-containing protein n=1 Tax=Vibrio mangrovi TaxID=474394 RepID=A0A1Y6IZC0_9VIBR|nr:DUF1488 domain-containing protein [Vibrio mangrovi]MDW6002291.1 DUF1488 domain-containing protein [Vibrio mangrovi]SMS02997.1 hypothetical protein VIM7927_04360 [Vibrio mangrovi]